MRFLSNEKSHCMKHACTYPREEDTCPYCRIAKLERQVAALDSGTVGSVHLGPSARWEKETIERSEVEAQKIIEALPVDRSQQVLTDGSLVPIDDSHTQDRGDGQQKAYVILTTEERAKGFVRPVRRSYKHVGERPKYATRPLTDEENERHGKHGYVAYEKYPDSEAPMLGRFWTRTQLDSGCGTVTKMGIALAETYARDPGFYSGTFCAGCRAHFPLAEFIWNGTDEIVGS